MFTFLHAADLHLDTPFSAVRARTMPEAVVEVLREASLRAWDRLVATAIERGVAFVVLAGDIYDGAERGVRAQRRVLDGLERLDAAGIRSFLVHGNHDPVDEGWTAIDRLPPLAHRFAPARESSAGIESIGFTVDGAPVTVHGVSYAVRATTENLALRFPSDPGPGFHVGVLHANVGGDTGHDPYSPASVADLRSRGIDYWALGHIHTRRVLHRDPWIVYPGNLQGRSPRVSERGPKGAVLVRVEHGRATEPELVPLDVVRFLSVTVDIGPLSNTGELIERLVTAADPAAHDGRSLIVDAEIVGSGPLHDELVDSARRSQVLDALQPSDSSEPFVWWNGITWSSRPAVDLDEARRGNDFLADLLATADGPAGGATNGGDWRDSVPQLPLDVVKLLDDVPQPRDPDIAARALALAVDHLTGGAR